MANDGIFAVLMAAIIDSAPLSGDEDALTIGQSVHRATRVLRTDVPGALPFWAKHGVVVH